MSSKTYSRLIDALPEYERTTVMAHLKQVEIPSGGILFSPGQRPRHVYFPLSGLISVNVQNTGLNVEVGLVGREGIPGSSRLLGERMSATQGVVLVAGSALRIDYIQFTQLVDELPELRRLVLQQVQYDCYLTEQLMACNTVHGARQRVARWLLMVTDRAGEQLVSVTQEQLANALGTRRTTVTLIAGSLKEQGLIRYSRGFIQVLNRDGLQDLACECYMRTRTLFDEL